MKKVLLIYGAGAIGRGFIPWVFPPEQFDYFFVDTNTKLLKQISKGYVTFMSMKEYNNAYVHKEIKPLKDIPNKFDAVITAVGPRACLSLADRFMRTEFPIIICENDQRLVKEMQKITGNPNIVFGIPDVITSNRGPEGDTGGICTEDGICYIEDRVKYLGGDRVQYCNDDIMRKQWLAKLYIHNTAHCIAAYLGYDRMCEHVHEAMEFEEIYNIVGGAMKECLRMCVSMYDLDEKFLLEYSLKELRRFSNSYLKDPISRVAREPLRKLAQGERLVGAASLCLQAGVEPKNIAEGIEAAVRYDDALDPDYLVMKHSRGKTAYEFLSFVGIPEREPIMQYLREVKK